MPGFRLRHVGWLVSLCLFTSLLGGAEAESEGVSETKPDVRGKPAHSGAIQPSSPSDAATVGSALFAPENLVAWCIVPFDAKKRGPQERVAMLRELGFTRYAYDWRAEHLPTFDEELRLLKANDIKLEAVWFPAALDEDARTILDLLKKHDLHTQLWVTMGDPATNHQEQAAKVSVAVETLASIAREAAAIGCRLELYNHGGWFGEPENQIEIIRALAMPNVGIVYNLHHGHDHLDRFEKLLPVMLPHLDALNLNGMDTGGDRVGRKILPLGEGSNDLDLLQVIRTSGYRGPIGILGHTDDDARERLLDNLDGLRWLLPQLNGQAIGPRPPCRTPVPPRPAEPLGATSPNRPIVADDYDPARVARLVAEAQASGNALRGAEVFRSAQFACLSCHKVGQFGGTVGPDLTTIGNCQPPPQIVESLLWPKRQVKPEYTAVAVELADGRVVQGVIHRESAEELVLREPSSPEPISVTLDEIESRVPIGSLMPDGLMTAMSGVQRRDLARFLFELGRKGAVGIEHEVRHAPAAFTYSKDPLTPADWPNRNESVNRDRVYDFYAKQADYFGKLPAPPMLLPEFPGLDGGTIGHWGNQDEKTWADGRWNDTDLGSLVAGIFRAGEMTIPRAVCVRLGDAGELAACFNPDTLCYEAIWKGGFVRFSSVRHGFMDGVQPVGTLLPRPAGTAPRSPFRYLGYHRYGARVMFRYRIGDTEYLDAPWVENGTFVRTIAPVESHPLAAWMSGSSPQWPEQFVARGSLGSGRPYAIDTIELPFDNPWKALVFCGDLDFLPDGAALVCTIQGDVWRADGLDRDLRRVTWRRVASGLHHALGMVIEGDAVYVQGRDQITRLHDANRDGEYDFYECVSNAFVTSPAGHDFVCGLARDAAGNFYTCSGNQGLLRISTDGRRADVLATGFRNPDGLALLPDGAITVPCSEGEWTPASMICLVQPGATGEAPHFGYGGPRGPKVPALPLVYLPRGLDNSSAAQAVVVGDRWGLPEGTLVHFSFGAASHFLLLRDRGPGTPQGAVVPLVGDFRSGVHRGRYRPQDGQLYVCGMAGWGTYGPADGCFQRVRYTGDPVQLPVGFEVHRNGIVVHFLSQIDQTLAADPNNHFAQCWNYRYAEAYGSPEFSPRHPGVAGHDPVVISSAWPLDDGTSLFVEMPDLQPVSQLHLRLKVDGGKAHDMFFTVHRLSDDFTNFPGYEPFAKVVGAHPLLVDLQSEAKPAPNPWRQPLPGARTIEISAGPNLTFSPRVLNARPGETIEIQFNNPDVVPHNWVLVKPDSLAEVGQMANRIIAEPDAAVRQYIPKSESVIAYTDVVRPGQRFSIYVQAPNEPGRYPYLCTFPGHWMVMNGRLVVE